MSDRPVHRDPMTVEEMVDQAAARITRYEPEAALAATEAGAQLIDTRSHSDRARAGTVPGSIHIPRTLFEWRASPEGEFRNPHLGDLERPVIVMCNHGYSSVLAAAALSDLGYERAGDLRGGFEAWREASLPIIAAPPHDPESEELEGMGPPEH